jgi:uncharacterized protein
LETIKRVAFEQMGERSSHAFKERGNKYHHGERTAKLAVRLRELIFPDGDINDEILTAAAFMHDICNGEEEHCEKGARLTRELLAGLCTAGELDEICEIIRVHDERDPQNGAYSDAIKLLQDADLLDHFGSNFVWIWFAYAIPLGQNAYDARDWQRENADDAERNRAGLNYALSRRIFDDKQAFVGQFSERFDAELAGEIWNEKEIVGGAI